MKRPLLGILGAVLLSGALLVAFVVSLFVFGWLPGLLPMLLVLFFAGWLVFSFLQYRYGRQSELLDLLVTATQANAPLAPVLHAYLKDRPHGLLRETWVGLLLFFPLPGYYWIWHRHRCYDAKVARLAYLLEQGTPLHVALRVVPGVAARETVLAAAVGESTGQLAMCLRNAATQRVAPVLMEMLPRLIYPFALLLVIYGIASFWLVFISPKMERIYKDFGQRLPESTLALIEFCRGAAGGAGALFIALLLQGAATVTVLLFLSGTVRWYLPGFAHFYRMNVQGRLLVMLGMLLRTGKPVPEALVVLEQSGSFSRLVEQRIEEARRLVERGEPFAASLHEAGLLPTAMVPLCDSAQRVGNLPWALAELGETLSTRMVRRARRLSIFLAPASVFLIGLLVGFIVLGIFMPVVDILGSLSE